MATFPSAADFVRDERFNQTFALPPDADHPDPLRVSYSDFGFRHPDGPGHDNVVLFCAPLFASRFLHITKDSLAKKRHIRVIAIDRPGFGSTAPVPTAADRVKAWLRIVPALLQHLGIPHVAILSQSAGAVYALNTLLHLRHLLHPTRPYAALCVPWVHPSHSGAALMSLTHKLPAAAIATVDSLAGFFNSTLQPVSGFGSSVSGFLKAPLGLGKAHPAVEGADLDAIGFEDASQSQIAAHAFRQGAKGMGQEALMLLKREGDPDVWGPWLDVDGFVPLLAAELSNVTALPNSTLTGSSRPPHDTNLEVEVFYSEQDNMIGTEAGPKWFNNCWRAEKRGAAIEYSSLVVPHTNHDTILDLRFGIADKIFEKVAQRNSSVGTGFTDPVT